MAMGYIPTSHMIREGGYEASGPFTDTSELEIMHGMLRLIGEVHSGSPAARHGTF